MVMLFPSRALLESMIRIVSNLLVHPVGNRRRHLTSTPFLFSAWTSHEQQTDHDGSERSSRYASASIKLSVLNSDAGPKHAELHLLTVYQKRQTARKISAAPLVHRMF